jgi:hypothetical protein
LPQLWQPTPLASDFQYHLTRGVYPALKAACAARPGVVLADYVDGHYIRFHSECSVISDMFILTRQHEEKIRESEALLAGSFAELLERAPYVRYIYVRRADNVLDDARGCGVACPENRGLRMELLARDAPHPGRLRLLIDLRLQAGTGSQPLARIFEITPSGLQ